MHLKKTCTDHTDAICCICGGGIETEPYFDGRNPWPVKNLETDGNCCVACDTFVVLPARMRRMAGAQ